MSLIRKSFSWTDLPKLLMTVFLFVAFASYEIGAGNNLRFDPAAYTVKSLTMPDGTTINYKAYEGIFYVTNH